MHLSRIRLLPRVADVESLSGPGKDDTRSREPCVSDRYHSFPGDAGALAATTKYSQPTSRNLIPERRKCPYVGRHRMVVEVTSDNTAQPLPECWDGLIHTPTYFPCDQLELRLHAVPSGLPFDQELAAPGFTADESEAQEVEGLRFTKSAVFAVLFCKSAELNEPVFPGCNVSVFSANCARNSSRKRRASLSCLNPTMKSSA